MKSAICVSVSILIIPYHRSYARPGKQRALRFGRRARVFGALLCLGRLGHGPAGVVGLAADLLVGADADVVGRLGLQAGQGRLIALDALDGQRLGVEELGVGAVADLVAGVLLALIPEQGDPGRAGDQLRDGGGLQDDPEGELAGAGEVALADDGHGGGAEVLVFGIFQLVVGVQLQQLAIVAHHGLGRDGLAGVGPVLDRLHDDAGIADIPGVDGEVSLGHIQLEVAAEVQRALGDAVLAGLFTGLAAQGAGEEIPFLELGFRDQVFHVRAQLLLGEGGHAVGDHAGDVLADGNVTVGIPQRELGAAGIDRVGGAVGLGQVFAGADGHLAGGDGGGDLHDRVFDGVPGGVFTSQRERELEIVLVHVGARPGVVLVEELLAEDQLEAHVLVIRYQLLALGGVQLEGALDGLQGLDHIDDLGAAVVILLRIRAVLVAVVDLGQGVAGVAGDQRHHVLGRGGIGGFGAVAGFVGDGVAAQLDGPVRGGGGDVVYGQVAQEIQVGQVRKCAVKGVVQIKAQRRVGRIVEQKTLVLRQREGGAQQRGAQQRRDQRAP